MSDAQTRRDLVDTQEIGAVSDADGEDPSEQDEQFAPRPRQRLGKATALLAALVLAGGGFLIGVQVQKNRPAKAASTGRSGFSGRGAFAGGAFSLGGAGGAGSAAGGGRTGSGSGSGTGSGSGSGSGNAATPSVIGTIQSVSANSIVVQNFGGKNITVTLSANTAVTKTVATTALKKGDIVSVVGTTGSDGKVAATTVSAK